MATETTDVVVVAQPPQTVGSGSYLEWSSVLGGAAVSAAITTMLTAFGSAIGLSLVSADPARSTGATALAVAAAIWVLWITVLANASGGYLAGRMRRPVADAGGHEREVRDGSHGLVVWAVGALFVAGLTASSVIGAARTAAMGAASAAGGAGALVSQQADPLGSALDTVMRSAGTTPTTPQEREEVSRIFVSGLASGQLAQGDREYVASRMAARMNIPQPDAERRLDEAFTRLNQAKETAKQAAEKARRMAVLSAFLTAAALLVGAVTAWLCAQLGGNHRDDGRDLGMLFGRR
jgi:hypothetical protein